MKLDCHVLNIFLYWVTGSWCSLYYWFYFSMFEIFNNKKGNRKGRPLLYFASVSLGWVQEASG